MLDAANISFNLLKVIAGEGITVGPILLGAAKPCHIVTPTATVRRLANLMALASVDAGRGAIPSSVKIMLYCPGRQGESTAFTTEDAEEHRGEHQTAFTSRQITGELAGGWK